MNNEKIIYIFFRHQNEVWNNFSNIVYAIVLLISIVRSYTHLFCFRKFSTVPAIFHVTNWKIHPTQQDQQDQVKAENFLLLFYLILPFIKELILHLALFTLEILTRKPKWFPHKTQAIHAKLVPPQFKGS